MFYINILLVYLILIKYIKSTQPGLDVNCSANGQTCQLGDCPYVFPFVWINDNQSCQIQDCSAQTFPANGLTDLFCASCPPDILTTKSQKYSNVDGTQCIASSATCGNQRLPNTWSDKDCQLCYSSSYYATTDKSKCVKSQATCSQNRAANTWNDSDCSLCSPSTPYANVNLSKCVNSSTTCGTKRSTSNLWSDDECKLCYDDGYKASLNLQSCLNCKATSNLTDKICSQCNGGNDGELQYANSEGTACVAIDCEKGENWTNADCIICNPKAPYASNDKSICISVTFSGFFGLNYIIIYLLYLFI
ncbi:cell surface immobilization antigen (macronuclear) [Tetrahymena thermophila SB210]|uniref:Cell surface immobilization antigen n=1 Tax=Tetrahymena thermophila (strain SB210) TaxID=312017 RepID=Q22TJ0_TETTS|nr:cell surface immobilization antigen [Tetrahymena thermophila SB210]EAR88448.1 cell surface immobilization antigen [Tetrahymena thermophila SB210]|eukprot:XP_001008693.1 cell surface immobilization antigen [Tetrahymena thermophila SB210]